MAPEGGNAVLFLEWSFSVGPMALVGAPTFLGTSKKARGMVWSGLSRSDIGTFLSSVLVLCPLSLSLFFFSWLGLEEQTASICMRRLDDAPPTLVEHPPNDPTIVWQSIFLFFPASSAWIGKMSIPSPSLSQFFFFLFSLSLSLLSSPPYLEEINIRAPGDTRTPDERTLGVSFSVLCAVFVFGCFFHSFCVIVPHLLPFWFIGAI